MNALLILAIEAAIKAGADIMNIYSGDFDVVYKSDSSPLTLADANANAVINAYLENTNIPIISEENKQTDYSIRKHWDTCWMVDPLDGTKEFVKRNGEFTVNIALIKDNKPILGVIYIPVTNTLYYGDVLEGKAYKSVVLGHRFSNEDLLQNSTALHPNTNNTNTLVVVGSKSHASEATDRYIQTLKDQGKDIQLVSKGSSLKFCLVAEGQADIYPRFAPTMEWDTAAGHAICNAVGLKVTQVDTHEALQYNKEHLLNPFFLVC
ncbi:3'(2'),5'-bisphosphate nucleotidase CysQ [Confluentibacter flavum]|uniref:3'(2'),5'-bisphosphate nucleotidase CysQ n=1 Tax=Confluentibacter flavum TaxID=1909700 RepID=A0A2N3HP28_9FLAO|nr:3'(2'),5'-bisphosphate nucleotidase CysQ [Confluentibacter flavum]PKQ46705.1 3'(2'),5'-bisphosphate nucleotidase [Confluentibacter flavum]